MSRAKAIIADFGKDWQGCKVLPQCIPSISRKVNVLRDHSIESMRMRKPAFSTKSRLQTVEIQRLLRRWQKYVVYAEMLLLTFYEEHPKIVLATNYIGISKRSCYLCAGFIRFHKFFSVEGQHQQLYCLWTLPAEIKFGSQAQGANFMKALSDLQLLLTQRVDEVTMPQHRSLAFLKESVANFSRATILARAHSLENLSTVIESDECLTSNIVHTPPNPGGEPPSVQLAREEKSKLETGQERVKEEAKTEISCSPLTEVEEPSPPDLGAVEHLQTQFAASPGLGISSSSDLGKELSHIGKRSQSNRCRRAEHRERRNRRRKSKRSPATQRSDRHARKKKTSAHSRTQVPPQVPASTRRHPKIVSQKKQKNAIVGCLSMLVACLKSASRRMMIVGSLIWNRLSTNAEKIQRAELFALGSILYELISGEQLFGDIGLDKNEEEEIHSLINKGEFLENLWTLLMAIRILVCWCPEFAKEMLAAYGKGTFLQIFPPTSHPLDIAGKRFLANSTFSRYLSETCLMLQYNRRHPVLFGLQVVGGISAIASAIILPILGAGGSIFAWCQSAAMGGAAVGGILVTSLARGGVAVSVTVAGVLDTEDQEEIPDLKERFLCAWKREVVQKAVL
ncbi:hypothetical protein EAF04_005711 [Stromatinia cepivora]|nr:hypothetical protein EAF04_005711 [Stromatinia cepivora]